jgi:hypothetical protein
MRFSRNERLFDLARNVRLFQHVGHVVDRAAAHLVGVVLEAALPVLMVVDLAVAEESEQSARLPRR